MPTTVLRAPRRLLAAALALALASGLLALPASAGATPTAASGAQTASMTPAVAAAGTLVSTGIRPRSWARFDPRNLVYRRAWGLGIPSCLPSLTVTRGSSPDYTGTGACQEGLTVGTPVRGLLAGLPAIAAATSNQKGSLNNQSLYVFVLRGGRVWVADLQLGGYKSTPQPRFVGGTLQVGWFRCFSGGCGPNPGVTTYRYSAARLLAGRAVPWGTSACTVKAARATLGAVPVRISAPYTRPSGSSWTTVKVTARNTGARVWAGRVGFLLTPHSDSWWRDAPRTVLTSTGQPVWPGCLDADRNGGNEPLYQRAVRLRPGTATSFTLRVHLDYAGDRVQVIPVRGVALLPGSTSSGTW